MLFNLNNFNDVLRLIVVKNVNMKKFWMNEVFNLILIMLNEFKVVIKIVKIKLLIIGVGI